MRHNKLLKQLVGLTLGASLLFGCSTPATTPTVITASPTQQTVSTSVQQKPVPTATTAQPTQIPPTFTSVPLTATPAPIPTASSVKELGILIGRTAQSILSGKGSEAEVLEVSPQEDGSLMAFVVDAKAKTLNDIALSFAAAIYLHRKDPLMPNTFKVMVWDSPSIITGKVKGLGIMKVADVIQWGEGKISNDGFLSRVDLRTGSN
jgi:hypothetical protein